MTTKNGIEKPCYNKYLYQGMQTSSSEYDFYPIPIDFTLIKNQ